MSAWEPRSVKRFIVDNRPGGGGNLGTAAAAKAEPDGYTILMSTSGPLAANRHQVRNLSYDPKKDFEPIGLFAIIPNIVISSAKLSVTTLSELIAELLTVTRGAVLHTRPTAWQTSKESR